MSGARRGESGHAYLILLVLAVFIGMIGMTMLVNSTAGTTAESRRDAQDRARCNSESGLTLTDFRLKAELPVLFKRVVTGANADARFGGQMMLSTLVFEPLEYHYAIPGEGNADDDTADVRVELTLPGPPAISNTSGVPSGPEVATVESYCFVARIRSVGHGRFGAEWTSERESHVYVTTVLGEIDAGTMAGLGSGNVIVADAGSSPLLAPRDPNGAWDIVPSVYADGTGLGVGSSTLRPIGAAVWGPGGSASGGWPRPPEVVTTVSGMTFPIAVGQPHGDTVYYWWMRGLPVGTTVVSASPEGAEGYVLALDTWRFDPSYSLADDAISSARPDGSIVRAVGTPRYGVVALRAPLPYKGAIAGNAPLTVTIYVPGRGNTTLTVSSAGWQPNTAPSIAPDGNRYIIVGTPSDFAPGAPIEARIIEPTPPAGGTSFTLDAVSESVIAQSRTDITVPGDVPASGGMIGTGGTGTTSGNIVLLTVWGKLADIGMQWSDGSAAPSTTDSRHQLIPGAPIELGSGGGGFIVDPPPPGGTLKVRILAVMYVPLWTNYVPTTEGPQPTR